MGSVKPRRALGCAFGLTLSATLTLASGCGGEVKVKGPKRIETPDQPYAEEGEKIAADPVAYLRQVLERCERLDAYRLTFYRQERLGLGLAKKLGPMEEIRAAFRNEPFSVKFEWDDPESLYYESVYVAGQNDNKLIVRERKGALPLLPPKVRVVDLKDPVKFGRARNPITNFGLAQVTRRIVGLFDNPKVADALTIRYAGVVDLEPMHEPAHHLRITQTPVEGYTHTRRDFYISAETLLPAGVDLWLENGDLDARYRYTDVNTDVDLTDADFRLSKDHPEEE